MHIALRQISKMETNQSLQRYHFKSNTEICFKQVTSVQGMPSSNWIVNISNNFILKWKSPWEFIVSGPVYTSVLSLVLVHVREHVWRGSRAGLVPKEILVWKEQAKTGSPWSGRRAGGMQTLKKLKGPWSPFLESQNISLGVQQEGRQWGGRSSCHCARVKRVKIPSNTPCVI